MVPVKLKLGVRVTLYFHESQQQSLVLQNSLGKSVYVGKVVSPREPKEKADLYWGYKVRVCSSLEKVFSECPYSSGYSFKVGTSEHG